MSPEPALLNHSGAFLRRLRGRDQSKERGGGKKQRRNQPRIAIFAEKPQAPRRIVDVELPKLP